MSFTFSTSQRGTASVPRRTGEKGRTHPHLSKRKELSTPRTATDLALNLWSSTWLVSTSLRANNPRQSLPLSTLPDKTAHSRLHLSPLRSLEKYDLRNSPSPHPHPLFSTSLVKMVDLAQPEFAFAAWMMFAQEKKKKGKASLCSFPLRLI